MHSASHLAVTWSMLLMFAVSSPHALPRDALTYEQKEQLDGMLAARQFAKLEAHSNVGNAGMNRRSSGCALRARRHPLSPPIGALRGLNWRESRRFADQRQLPCLLGDKVHPCAHAWLSRHGALHDQT